MGKGAAVLISGAVGYKPTIRAFCRLVFGTAGVSSGLPVATLATFEAIFESEGFGSTLECVGECGTTGFGPSGNGVEGIEEEIEFDFNSFFGSPEPGLVDGGVVITACGIAGGAPPVETESTLGNGSLDSFFWIGSAGEAGIIDAIAGFGDS